MLQTVKFEKQKALPISNTNKEKAITELIEHSKILKKKVNLDEFKQAVFARENQQNTGFGHGIAVAHGKIEGIKEMYITMGVSRSGINYQSYDGEPVRILFVVANPPEMQETYLQVICCLMKILKDPYFRESMVLKYSGKVAAKKLFERFSSGLLMQDF